MKMETWLEYEISSVLAAPPEARIVDEARCRNLIVHPMTFSGSVRIQARAPLFHLHSHEGIDIVNTHGSHESRNTAPTSNVINIPAICACNTDDLIRDNRIRLLAGRSKLSARMTTTRESI